METSERRPSPVDRQLELYRDSWQADHKQAMRCFDWEEVIAVGIATYRLLRQREETWRDRVFRGALAFDPADERDQLDRLRLWLTVTEAILRDVAPSLEREFGKVEGAEELREGASVVRNALAAWQPPRLSAAVGLREMTLSAEEAAGLDRILEESRKAPLPMPKPDVVKKDASWLK